MAASYPDLADTSKLNGSLVMYRMDVDPVPTCPRYGKAQILSILGSLVRKYKFKSKLEILHQISG